MMKRHGEHRPADVRPARPRRATPRPGNRMARYLGLNGDTGVTGYWMGEDFIAIKFRDDGIYLYTTDKPGRVHLENMKSLARRGRGLTTYINKWVRGNYARKLRD
jgi:hypothetical protein